MKKEACRGRRAEGRGQEGQELLETKECLLSCVSTSTREISVRLG